MILGDTKGTLKRYLSPVAYAARIVLTHCELHPSPAAMTKAHARGHPEAPHQDDAFHCIDR